MLGSARSPRRGSGLRVGVARRRLPSCGSGLPASRGGMRALPSPVFGPGGAGSSVRRRARGSGRCGSRVSSSTVPEVDQVMLQRGSEEGRRRRGLSITGGCRAFRGSKASKSRVHVMVALASNRSRSACLLRSFGLGLRLAARGGWVARAATGGEGSSPRCSDRLRSGVGGAARKARGVTLGRSSARSGAELTAGELLAPRGAQDL
jgi:hypothetical protein